MHILEGRADGNVAHPGIAGFHLLHGQIGADPPGRSHFQAVIIDGHLDGARRNIGAMAYGVRDHFPDAIDGQFVEILPIDTRNPGAQSDIALHEQHRFLNLLVDGTGGFLPVQEDSTCIAFEHGHLDDGIRKKLFRVSEQSPGIGGKILAIEEAEDLP